jgi:hypothetical protein
LVKDVLSFFVCCCDSIPRPAFSLLIMVAYQFVRVVIMPLLMPC